MVLGPRRDGALESGGRYRDGIHDAVCGVEREVRVAGILALYKERLAAKNGQMLSGIRPLTFVIVGMEVLRRVCRTLKGL